MFPDTGSAWPRCAWPWHPIRLVPVNSAATKHRRSSGKQRGTNHLGDGSKRIATRRVVPCASSRTTCPNRGKRGRSAVSRPIGSVAASSRCSPTSGASRALVRNAACSALRSSIQALTCPTLCGRRYENVKLPSSSTLVRRRASRCGGCVMVLRTARVGTGARPEPGPGRLPFDRPGRAGRLSRF